MWALPVVLAKLAYSSCNRNELSAPILPMQGHLVKIFNSFLFLLAHFPISQETSPENTDAVTFVHMWQGSANIWSHATKPISRVGCFPCSPPACLPGEHRLQPPPGVLPERALPKFCLQICSCQGFLCFPLTKLL